jgi:hypothetical protein
VWAGTGAASANGRAKGRGASGRFAKNGANNRDPAAVVLAVQNGVAALDLLDELLRQASAAVEADGVFRSLVDDAATGDESLGTTLVLYERPARGPKPTRAAGAFWETFVKSGCLDRLTEQVQDFLRERQSPEDLLPSSPFMAFLIKYAEESGDATGGTAASAQWGEGLKEHYDTVPHCAVTLSLTGDGDAPGLYWICHGERRELHLDAGDIAILARGVLHGVERIVREEARMVVVLFY